MSGSTTRVVIPSLSCWGIAPSFSKTTILDRRRAVVGVDAVFVGESCAVVGGIEVGIGCCSLEGAGVGEAPLFTMGDGVGVGLEGLLVLSKK